MKGGKITKFTPPPFFFFIPLASSLYLVALSPFRSSSPHHSSLSFASCKAFLQVMSIIGRLPCVWTQRQNGGENTKRCGDELLPRANWEPRPLSHLPRILRKRDEAIGMEEAFMTKK
jgi:hypothetical protein